MATNDIHPMRALDADEIVTEVAVTWGDGVLLEVVHLRAGERFTPRASALAGEAVAPLVRAFEDRAELDLPPGAVMLGDPAAGAIIAGDRTALVVMGELRYAVRRVRGARRVAGRVQVDRRPFAYVLGSGLVHLVIFGIFALEPPKAGALSVDVLDTQSRIVAHYIEAQSAPPPEPLRVSGSTGGTEGGGAQGERGAAGDPAHAPTGRHLAIRGHAAESEQRPGPLSAEVVTQAGVLGVLGGMQAAFGGPSSPYASNQAIGASAIDALGALLGATPGDSFGVYGLALTGPGAGGGHLSGDTIGAGPFATIGVGGDPRGRRPYGVGVGGCEGELCGRATRVPPGVDIGRPDAHGALAAEVIRRVVSRHRAEIRFCYEQGLQQDPGLEGRVTARFIIGPTGAVTTSMVGASSIRHRGVEQCVAQAVRRWSFPAPESGGVVTVSYPFVFRSGS